MIYKLQTVEQATALMKKIWPEIKLALSVNQKMTLEIKEANKSRDQEAKYHAMLSEIAVQAQHMGAKWDAESWKRFLVYEFCKQLGLPQGQIVPSLDGSGIVQLGLQTRDFSKERAAEFIEFLEAWAADKEIIFKNVDKPV